MTFQEIVNAFINLDSVDYYELVNSPGFKELERLAKIEQDSQPIKSIDQRLNNLESRMNAFDERMTGFVEFDIDQVSDYIVQKIYSS